MRLLLSILAAMLMVQSASAQALWRNYWTTNRYPQNASSLTNLQATNITGTIPPASLSTNTPAAGHVLTATSAGSAAWDYSNPAQWSFVTIPDWQNATSNTWRVAVDNLLTNIYSWNTKYVLFTGDLLNDQSSDSSWMSVTSAVYRLSLTNACLLVPGNHDIGAGSSKVYTNWNTYFPQGFYTNAPWWSGMFASNNVSSAVGIAQTFTNSFDDKWLFVGLESDFSTNAALWASNTIASYPKHHAILFTHTWLTARGTIFNSLDLYKPALSGVIMPESAWSSIFSYLPNLRFIISGHDLGTDQAKSIFTSKDGHTVQMIFLNYQSAGFSTNAVARIWTVDSAANTITANTIIPHDMTSVLDSGGKFQLPITGNSGPITAQRLSVIDSVLYESDQTTNFNGAEIILGQADSTGISTNSWSLFIPRHSSGELQLRAGTNQSAISNSVVMTFPKSGGPVFDGSGQTNILPSAFSFIPFTWNFRDHFGGGCNTGYVYKDQKVGSTTGADASINGAYSPASIPATGFLRVTPTNSTTSYAYFGPGNPTTVWYSNLVFRCSVIVDDISSSTVVTNNRFEVGMLSHYNASSPTDGLRWFYDDTWAAYWIAGCGAGSSWNYYTSSIPATTLTELSIVGTTNLISFVTNGVVAYSTSSNIPGGKTMSPIIRAYHTTATDQGVRTNRCNGWFDYAEWYGR